MLLSSAVDQKHWHQLRPYLIGIVPTKDCHTKSSARRCPAYGVSGVFGVIKRRIGAKFDNAGRLWVFGLVRSRNLHVEATDINMTIEIDLGGEDGFRDCLVDHIIPSIHIKSFAEGALFNTEKARVVGEMIIETLNSTDSCPESFRKALTKGPRGGGRQHLPCLSGLDNDDQDMCRHRTSTEQDDAAIRSLLYRNDNTDYHHSEQDLFSE